MTSWPAVCAYVSYVACLFVCVAVDSYLLFQGSAYLAFSASGVHCVTSNVAVDETTVLRAIEGRQQWLVFRLQRLTFLPLRQEVVRDVAVVHAVQTLLLLQCGAPQRAEHPL